MERLSLFLGLFVGISTCLSSCDEPTKSTPDTSINEEQVVGQYTLKTATLNDGVESSTTFTKGKEVTENVKMLFFSRFKCNDSAHNAVVLKEDKEMHAVCVGESKDTQGGTWKLQDDNKNLVINLNDSISPEPYEFKIIDINVENSTISGNADIPLNIPEKGFIWTNAHLVFHKSK